MPRKRKKPTTRAKKKSATQGKRPARNVTDVDPFAHFSDKERAQIPQSPHEVAQNLNALADRLHSLANSGIHIAIPEASKPERFRDSEMCEAGTLASLMHWKIRHAEIIEAGLNAVPPNRAASIRALLHGLIERLRNAIDNFAINWHGFTPEDRKSLQIAQGAAFSLHKAIESSALGVERLREAAEQCEADEESLWIWPTEAKKLWNGLITRQAANKAVNSAIGNHKLRARGDGKILRAEVEKMVEESKTRQKRPDSDNLDHLD